MPRPLTRRDYRTLALAALGGDAVTGFFVGRVTTVPIVAVRLFPAPRFSGLSFSYNLSYAVLGGLTPVRLSLWLRTDPMAPAYYVGGLALLWNRLAFVPNSATL